MKRRSEYKEKIKKHFNNFRLESSDLKKRKSTRHQSVGSRSSSSLSREFSNNSIDSTHTATLQQEVFYMPSPMSSEISLVDNDLLASVNNYLLPSNAFVDMGPQYADINCFLGLNQFVGGNQTVPIQQATAAATLNHDLVPVTDISQLLHDTSLHDYPPPQHIKPFKEESHAAPVSHAHEWCEMPSRPKPPVLKNGPNYVVPSPGFIAYFHHIDADDSGTITFEELQDYLHNKDSTNPRHFNDEAVSTLIEMFDKNKDKTIDKEEFPALLAYIRNWELCFTHLDRDNTGRINYPKMHEAIQGLGIPDFSSESIRRLLVKYDSTGGNEEIDFDNFIMICVSLARFKETYDIMKTKFGSIGLKDMTLEDFITRLGAII